VVGKGSPKGKKGGEGGGGDRNLESNLFLLLFTNEKRGGRGPKGKEKERREGQSLSNS